MLYRMYRLATKHTGKSSRGKTPTCVFGTQITTRALVYSALLTVENLTRSTSRNLLVPLECIEFVRSNFTRKNRIAYQPFV